MGNTHKLIHYVKMNIPRQLYWGQLVRRRAKFWREAGVIFIHIPKNGGTSINQALYGQFMGHYSASAVAKNVPKLFESLPLFAISRNPWDRCASAYRFAVSGSGGNAPKTVAMSHHPDYLSPQFESFEKFVCEWLPAQDLSKIDYVFQPQINFVDAGDKKPIVDFMGKIEDMSKVTEYLSEILESSITVEHFNKTGEPGAYRHLYTPEMRDIIGGIYVDDIKGFNYEF